MVPNMEDVSQVTDFFNGSTVFLTGATGYLGGMFMEKLIRVCDDINKIYVLLRPKKGKTISERFDELFDGPNYEPLKKLKPNYREKVELIPGDLHEKDLGLSEEDKTKLINNVDCVIHCGATVRFDEHLRKAAYINVRSVIDLMKISKEMTKLRVFLYVSTAFSNCTRSVIDEKVYDPPVTGHQLLRLLNAVNDDDLIAKITPKLIGKYPNTYTFTKIIAESIVKNEGKGIPIAIHRPSIVVASLAEPVRGWINNMYGFTGVLVGAALGLLRVIHGKSSNNAELIPADIVVNSAIAAIWDVATQKFVDKKEKEGMKYNNDSEDKLVVYNCVSSAESPLTWVSLRPLVIKAGLNYPTPKIIWYWCFDIYEHEITYQLAKLFLHTVPAYIIDFIVLCLGKKPIMVKAYQKINKFIDVLEFFAMNQWEFKNDNTQELWRKLSEKDRKIYPFTMSNFDWENYFHANVIGGRLYILKDPLDTIPQGRIKRTKAKIAHYTLLSILWFMLFTFLMYLYNFVANYI